MIEHLPRIRPFQSEEEFKALVAAAQAEQHNVITPCFGVWRGDKPIGFVSISPMPVTFVWFSSTEVRPRESFELINSVENHLVMGGASGVLVPVRKASPFNAVMPHLGYRSSGEAELFVKAF